MPKGTRQKLKLLYLIKFLLEKTDEEHKATMPEILSYLEANEITAERKSIYADLESIRDLGIDVQGEKQGRGFGYYIGARDFEIAELKLLVDAIQSSKFITEKKSAELIKKLSGLVSIHEAKQLKRQVYVSGRAKTVNESIFYNIDTLHNAIEENKKIIFQYFQWNTKKEMELRKNGSFYEVSPWALVWEDENYYLVAYDALEKEIRHYRVDKMLKIDTLNLSREGKEHFERFNIAEYTKKSFGMFAGEEEMVKLLIHKSMIGVMIDRFGRDIMIVPIDEEQVRVNVKVAVSDQFLGWVFGLGSKIKIQGPQNVVDKMKNQVEVLQKLYENQD
ncbi:MAG: WYL domain-containing protein [Lachnospiraceae bacterium]|nr:WYL domain-containing protein [Lachnospiraceae bacterium]